MSQAKATPMHIAAEFGLAVENDGYPKTDYSNLQLRGNLDTQAFVEAFNEVIPNMPITRSLLEQRREGMQFKLYWVPQDDRPAQIHVEDCRHRVKHPLNAIEFMAEYHQERVYRRLDLFKEPPLQFFLVQLTDEIHMLSMIYHHIAVDAGSAYVHIKDILARYHEKVTGEMPYWKDARSITSALSEVTEVKSLSATAFLKEQAQDLFLSSQARVSQVATKQIGIQKGRYCYRYIFDDPRFMEGVKIFARRNNATFGDILAASMTRSISKWDRDKGSQKDQIRSLLAVNIRNRVPSLAGENVALSGLMVKLTSPNRMDLDQVVQVYRDHRIDQLNRGVDIAYYKMLHTVAKSMQWMPLRVRRRVAGSLFSLPITYIMSNMGVMWPEVVKGKSTGQSLFTRAGGIEIDDVHSSPSLTKDVGMGMQCRTLGNRFFLNFVYDRFRFSKEESQELSDRMNEDLAALTEFAPKARQAI